MSRERRHAVVLQMACLLLTPALFKAQVDSTEGVELDILRPASLDVAWTTEEQIDVTYLVRQSWRLPHGCIVEVVINNIPVSSSAVTSYPMTISFSAGTIPAGLYRAHLSVIDEQQRPLRIEATAQIRVMAAAVGGSGPQVVLLAPSMGQINYVGENIKFRLKVSGMNMPQQVRVTIDGEYSKHLTVSVADEVVEWHEKVEDWTLGIWMCRANVFCPGVRRLTATIGGISTSVSFVLAAIDDLVPFSCPSLISRSDNSAVLIGTGDGQWEEASVCYSHALMDLAPTSNMLWEKLAAIERFSGRRARAIASYRTVLRLFGSKLSAVSALSSLVAQRSYPAQAARKEPPYLSVILMNRYDDSVLCNGPTVGTCISRHRASMQVWLLLLRKYQLSAELILVEYNPIASYPSMAEIMAPLLDFEGCTTSVRIITVPSALHESMPNPGNTPVFEWVAKNAGVRRAKGEFVLITNGDCVFSDEMVGTLARQDLRHDVFYSTLRRTFMTETVPVSLNVPGEAMVDFTQHRLSKMQPADMAGYFGPKSEHWRHAACKPLEHQAAGPLQCHVNDKHCNVLADEAPADPEGNFSRLFNFAPGDLFLIARSTIHAFRGAPQVPQATGTDSALLFIAAAHGCRQLLFPAPCTFLHQEHMTLVKYNAHTFEKLDEIYDRIMKAGRLANIMDKSGVREPHRWNDENWGFGQIELPEVELNPAAR